jgi:cadmium resistance protein CadD (predicted permease)
VGSTLQDNETWAAGSRNIIAVAAVTIANGGDNISIYMPIFSTRTTYEIAVIGLVFAVMTAIWLVVAHFLTNHPKMGAPIRLYGHRIVPFVLIALGILILYEADTAHLIF